MDQLWEWVNNFSGLSIGAQHKLLESFLVLVVLLFARYLVLKVALRRVEDPRLVYRWRKSASYLTFIVVVMALGWVWFEAFDSLPTFLGLLSAGIAIALKDMLINLVAFVFIMWRRPFIVGDRIEIGEHAGDVIDIRIFQFTLLEINKWVDADQSTGRVVHIPNGVVFTQPQANYDKGFRYIWNEMPVLLTFESNWEKAKGMLQKIADAHDEELSEKARKKILEAARNFMIYYTHLTPTVYTSVRDSGVLLTIRYLTEPRKRRGSEQAIWEDILREFSKHKDIDFAYPTQRFYNNLAEGKGAVKDQLY